MLKTKEESIEWIKNLIERNAVFIFGSNGKMPSLVHMLARYGRIDLIEKMKQNCPDRIHLMINNLNKSQETTIEAATQQPDVVQFLLNIGVAPLENLHPRGVIHKFSEQPHELVSSIDNIQICVFEKQQSIICEKYWTDEDSFKTGGDITCLEVKENQLCVYQIRARYVETSKM